MAESWLQDLIFQQASVLPVEQIEPEYAPLVPIGREVRTQAGPIDALYVSPEGLLTLVEAKLWRNPEARREVVGQIIDYANQLSSWTYAELDERTRRQRGMTLWQWVATSAPDDLQLEEAEFVDAVTRNLARGRFLLLIVGDGIKESVEDLARFLQGTPHLQFSLALVELRLYRMPDDPDRLLVAPSVVTRTKEVVRAVVATDTNGPVSVRVRAMDETTGAETRTNGARRGARFDEVGFLTGLAGHTSDEAAEDLRDLFRSFEARGLIVDFLTANVKVKLPDPGGSGRDFSLLGIRHNGEVYISLLASQTTEEGYAYEGGAAQRYIDEVSRLVGREPIPNGKNGRYPEKWKDLAPLSQLLEQRDEYLDILDRFRKALATVEKP